MSCVVFSVLFSHVWDNVCVTLWYCKHTTHLRVSQIKKRNNLKKYYLKQVKMSVGKGKMAKTFFEKICIAWNKVGECEIGVVGCATFNEASPHSYGNIGFENHHKCVLIPNVLLISMHKVVNLGVRKHYWMVIQYSFLLLHMFVIFYNRLVMRGL